VHFLKFEAALFGAILLELGHEGGNVRLSLRHDECPR